MPPKRPLPPHSPSSSSRPPPAPADVTRRLLQRFYRDVRVVADLVDPETRLVRADDSVDFRELVEGTVFASVEEGQLPKLSVSESSFGSVSMSEVVDQVQHRIFAAHAKVFHREKKAGRPAFATPKHTLTLGYRLSTDRTKEMSQARGSRKVSFVNIAANTVISSLTSSRAWETLLSRLGPDALIELFSNPSLAVFTSLPNGCFLQVGGVPLVELKPLDVHSSNAEQTTGHGRPKHVRTKRKRYKGGRGRIEEEQEEQEGNDEMDVDTPPIVLPPPRLVLESPSPTKSALRPTVSAPLFPSSAFSTHNLAPTQGPSQPSPARLIRPLRATQSVCSVTSTTGVAERPKKRRKLDTINSSNSIVLSRHRMYHNRLSRAKKGLLTYGFPVNHILTRLTTLFPTLEIPATDAGFVEKARGEAPARHLAKYLFPRQFGLHNPFTFAKPKSSFEVVHDYVDRELEIKKLGSMKTPPRLRSALPLVTRLALLSRRCNYRKLLDQRCPSKMTHKRLDVAEKSAVLDLVSEPRTQATRADNSVTLSHSSLVLPRGGTQAEKHAENKPKLAEYACSFYEVDSYVNAVVSQVIPRAFWGSEVNQQLVQRHISSFIRLRRWESPSVHALLQGFSVLDCAWLASTSTSYKENKQQKPNSLDLGKRREMLSDFLFWLFDGFIIDLIRTAFYVTDAATHQNRPLYFRQDDWNALCAPLLENLGRSVFEKSQLIPLQRKRELGFSFVRLLPKETGVRPIVNLARRPLKIGLNGQKEMGQPINKILQGVFDVLTFEKKRKPHLVGSLVSDPLGIFSKLKHFKTRLLAKNGDLPKLYFVKVDVRACFDTIQQDKLLEIVEEILTETVYWIQKYSKVTPAGQHAGKQFKRQACTDSDLGQFEELAQALAEELHSAVLADSVVYNRVYRDKLMQLLREHITTNLVKVGGRLFRQKDGIPQGSILSSLLCSLFYGNMERKKLAFTDDAQSVLLRYVDDFLFVTTKKDLATRLLRVMDAGIPEYGCYISAEKRLTNFDVALRDGEVVPPLLNGQDFPWCGLAVNTRTLDIQFSTQSQMERDIVDQLTIQRDRKPGQAFVNAMFRAVKVRTHVLYSDTSYNSPTTAYSNVYRGMIVVALKFQAYVQEWGIDAMKSTAYLLRSIRQIVAFSHAALVHRARARKARLLKVEFTLKRQWAIWLGYHAFLRVLSRRPSVNSVIIQALEKEVGGDWSALPRKKLARVVSSESTAFADKTNAARKVRRV